ncbi:hemicentin-1-like [Limulus polyphemus]|uniref:Hemicentin-1-like n=1 Tax=Limulus polyphemus TaxID=6850 RepID=A0ABM1RZJ7_LIMPO|nr:hemicentin-1-like [Limulus polyphemus]
MTTVHYLFAVWAIICHCFFHSFGQETGPAIKVDGIVGQEVALPCNITAPTFDDDVALVLWYKDESSTPIYSLDARRGVLGHGRHSSSDNYATRTYFSTVSKPATLQLTSVTKEDEGRYTCRVDFRKARTRYSEIMLKIIVPPNKPRITDEKGEVILTVAGPYNEGDRLVLLCESEGGKPKPSLTWWKDFELIDDSYEVTPQEITFNQLHVPTLHRNDLMSSFTCEALNNNLSLPISTSVKIDMNLKPIQLDIEGAYEPLSSGKLTELQCRTSGSRPPATVTWWKGNRKLKRTKNWATHNGNVSISTLTFQPSLEDNGKYLSCRAENPKITNSAIENGWKLEIHHVPILSLRLGSKLRHSHIQEGYDIYFECDIIANPWVTDMSWEFERKELSTNTSVGVIISNQSLVLQNVNRSSRGRYTCRATNAQGEGVSNPLHLKVQFAPTCRNNQKSVYGAARHETVKIFCDVEADPIDVKFQWRFNNTKEVLDVTTFENKETRSIATFSPRGDGDYGTILCWGKNSVGTQKKPCVFKLVPAGPPDAVANCSLQNQTEHSIELECSEAYNGGLSQHFIMEVHDTTLHKLRANISSPEARFYATGLPSGTKFVVIVYAVNAKGRSNALVLRTSTLAAPQKQSHRETVWQMNFSPVLVILVAVVAGFVLVACIIVVGIKARAKYHHPEDTRSAKTNVHDGNDVVNHKKPNGLSETFSSWEPVDSEKVPASIPLLLQAPPASPSLSETSGTTEAAMYEQRLRRNDNDVKLIGLNGKALDSDIQNTHV